MSDDHSHSTFDEKRLNPILVGFGVLAVVAGLTITAMLNAGRPKYDHADLKTVASLKKEQRVALKAPSAVLNKEKGIVSLPIERAQKLVVEEIARDPQAATIPAPAPEPVEGDAALSAGGASAGTSAAPTGRAGAAAAAPSTAAPKPAGAVAPLAPAPSHH